jgi:DNA-binding NtrC family response regulator
MSTVTGKQLLVVDDEATMRQALETSFRRAGWVVGTAAGLDEAIAKFCNDPFPVVITDMRMPDGTGIDVLRHLRTAVPKTAVILLTAYASVPDAVQAMKLGASDYMVKPVSFERLQNAVTRALRNQAAALGICPEQTSPAGRPLMQNSIGNPHTACQGQIRSGSGGFHAGESFDFDPMILANCLRPGLPLREAERILLQATLAATEGNRTRAAEMLGVSLRTIRNKIRAYGLPPRRSA